MAETHPLLSVLNSTSRALLNARQDGQEVPFSDTVRLIWCGDVRASAFTVHLVTATDESQGGSMTEARAGTRRRREPQRNSQGNWT